MHAMTSTSIHVEPDEVVGANIYKMNDDSYALKIGSPYWSYVTVFVNKQQLVDIFRDMDVLYMSEFYETEEEDLVFP